MIVQYSRDKLELCFVDELDGYPAKPTMADDGLSWFIVGIATNNAFLVALMLQH